MSAKPLTYTAIQATAPGKLELVEKLLVDPGNGQVRIHVQACGVCHSDAATVEGAFPIQWPRVPGHEAVGVIDAIGANVEGWAIGQRVGVGFLGGSCGHCAACRGGDLVNCKNQEYTGIHHGMPRWLPWSITSPCALAASRHALHHRTSHNFAG